MKPCAGIIIENDNDELLLQLRDDEVKDFPNHWVLLGGAMEDGEKPRETLKREMKEELGIEIGEFEYFRTFDYNNKLKQVFFYKKINLDPKKINLMEGKEIRFFSKKDLDKVKFGFNIKEVINIFLESRKNE